MFTLKPRIHTSLKQIRRGGHTLPPGSNWLHMRGDFAYAHWLAAVIRVSAPVTALKQLSVTAQPWKSVSWI